MWAVFIAFVLVMQVIDRFVFGANKAQKFSVKEAALWSLAQKPMQPPTMNPEQQRAILAIAQNALFADGAKHEREREQMRRIPKSLGAETSAPDLAIGKETAS